MKNKQLIAFFFLCSLSIVSQAGQLSVFEDFLYWHVSEQPTSVWAYQFTPLASGNPSFPTTQGTYFTEPNVYFGWSPGLRAGIHYQPNHFFDTKLYWTHFSTNTSEALSVTPGQYLLPEFFSGFTSANVFTDAQLDWTLDLNIVDLEMGHAFNPLSTITVRPFIGLKGGTINQALNSYWQFNELNYQLSTATEFLKNNFFGLGPTLGLNNLWHLNEDVGLRGDFETALLWGYWNVQDSYNGPGPLLSPMRSISTNTKNSLGTFMTSAFLGLEWSLKTKLPLTLRAGYEMQFWSNQLRLPLFQAVPIHGDLTLQGGTCGIYINLS